MNEWQAQAIWDESLWVQVKRTARPRGTSVQQKEELH